MPPTPEPGAGPDAIFTVSADKKTLKVRYPGPGFTDYFTNCNCL